MKVITYTITCITILLALGCSDSPSNTSKNDNPERQIGNVSLFTKIVDALPANGGDGHAVVGNVDGPSGWTWREGNAGILEIKIQYRLIDTFNATTHEPAPEIGKLYDLRLENGECKGLIENPNREQLHLKGRWEPVDASGGNIFVCFYNDEKKVSFIIIGDGKWEYYLNYYLYDTYYKDVYKILEDYANKTPSTFNKEDYGHKNLNHQLEMAKLLSDDPREMMRHIGQAIYLSKDDPKVYLEASNILSSEGGRSQAKELLEKGWKIAPEDPAFPYSLGLLAVEERNWEDAASFLEKATTLDPNHYEAWVKLSSTYEKLGRTFDAASAKTRSNMVKNQGSLF